MGLLLLINTSIGTYWFAKLIEQQKEFVLDDNYYAYSIILLVIPWMIFLFLLLLLVKVISFFFSQRKRGVDNDSRRQSRFGKYGQFSEDDDEVLDPETEAIIRAYFRIMDEVIFSSSDKEEELCHLCQQYFKQ